jgi:hypothetical protein
LPVAVSIILNAGVFISTFGAFLLPKLAVFEFFIDYMHYSLPELEYNINSIIIHE